MILQRENWIWSKHFLNTAHGLMRRSLDASVKKQTLNVQRNEITKISPHVTAKYASFSLASEDKYITTNFDFSMHFKLDLHK